MKSHHSSDDRSKELYDKYKEKDDMKIGFEVVEITNKDIEAEMKRMPKFMTQAEIDALDEIDKTHLP